MVACKFVCGVSQSGESNPCTLVAGVFSGAAVSASKNAPGASSWILASPSNGAGFERHDISPCRMLDVGVLYGTAGNEADDDMKL
jgi:hypothetical protein